MTLSYRSRQLGSGRVSHSGKSKLETWHPAFSKWGVVLDPYSTLTAVADDNLGQVTGSESHQRGSDGKYHSGGPFYTQKSGFRSDVVLYSGEIVFSNSEEPLYRITGDGYPIVIPEPYASNFISHEGIPERSKDLSDLDSLGATAISRCSPANPASEVGTSVSELYHEGLPALPGIRTWQQRTSVAKAAGSEYLNKVFGWDPLRDEVKSFASVVARHRDILNQYSRNAGTLVHRSYNFPIDNSEESEVVAKTRVAGPGWASGTHVTPEETPEPPEITLTRGKRTRSWFSGAFTYDVPSQTDTWKKALGYGSDADILFGASLNPSLLWNLTPWSWAADWFSNTGDVINNISNYVRAGQIMQYGFMMSEETSFTRLSMSGSGYPGIPAPAPIEYFSITKVRTPANPYGFGIELSDLSPTQLAIAAALGITLL